MSKSSGRFKISMTNLTTKREKFKSNTHVVNPQSTSLNGRYTLSILGSMDRTQCDWQSDLGGRSHRSSCYVLWDVEGRQSGRWGDRCHGAERREVMKWNRNSSG